MKNTDKSRKDLEQLFEEALDKLKTTTKLEGADGEFTPVLKCLLEATVLGEMGLSS